MAMKSIVGTFCACVITVSFSSNAALIGRDLDGNNTTAEAYFDDQLNITWMADANSNGFDTWDNAMAWAGGLNIGGFTGWRLPSADVNGDSDPNNTGTVVNCNVVSQAACKDNEFGHLYHYGAGTTLGSGIDVFNPDPFSNILGIYWFSTEFGAPEFLSAYTFSFSSGGTSTNGKFVSTFMWAVHDGDIGNSVSAVPIPAAVWLFGSGLIGLIGLARRKETGA